MVQLRFVPIPFPVANYGTAMLGVGFDPREIRLTRWKDAFAQYRPHHARWLALVDSALPPTVELAGSAYRGIGVPACVRDGRRAADALLARPGPGA